MKLNKKQKLIFLGICISILLFISLLYLLWKNKEGFTDTNSENRKIEYSGCDDGFKFKDYITGSDQKNSNNLINNNWQWWHTLQPKWYCGVGCLGGIWKTDGYCNCACEPKCGTLTKEECDSRSNNCIYFNNKCKLKKPIPDKDKNNNSVIKQCVDDYLSGDKNKKNEVVKQYGEIENWDTSLVTDMSNLFKDKTEFNSDISKWNTSQVINMSHMFNGAEQFNQHINTTKTYFDIYWDTSNVTDMSYMFRGATSFNQNLTCWVLDKVVNTTAMFDESGMEDNNKPDKPCRKTPIPNKLEIQTKNTAGKLISYPTSGIKHIVKDYLSGDKEKKNKVVNTYGEIKDWDTSQVTDMSYLFKNMKDFNEDISKWNTSNVTNMKGLFFQAEIFNQNITTKTITADNNLPTGKEYTAWDTSSVENMSHMFQNAREFNQDISNWNISNVTDMSYMFRGATSFNQSIDKWDTSKVTNMSGMLSLNNFNKPIGNWNTSNVTTMHGLFYLNKEFNQPIDKWDTSKVTKMSSMFNGASNFNQDINTKKIIDENGTILYIAWETSKVTDMSGMFRGSTNFTKNINGWDISKVTNFRDILLDCPLNLSINDELHPFKCENGYKFNNNLTINDLYKSSDIEFICPGGNFFNDDKCACVIKDCMELDKSLCDSGIRNDCIFDGECKIKPTTTTPITTTTTTPITTTTTTPITTTTTTPITTTTTTPITTTTTTTTKPEIRTIELEDKIYQCKHGFKFKDYINGEKLRINYGCGKYNDCPNGYSTDKITRIVKTEKYLTDNNCYCACETDPNAKILYPVKKLQTIQDLLNIIRPNKYASENEINIFTNLENRINTIVGILGPDKVNVIEKIIDNSLTDTQKISFIKNLSQLNDTQINNFNKLLSTNLPNDSINLLDESQQEIIKILSSSSNKYKTQFLEVLDNPNITSENLITKVKDIIKESSSDNNFQVQFHKTYRGIITTTTRQPTTTRQQNLNKKIKYKNIPINIDKISISKIGNTPIVLPKCNERTMTSKEATNYNIRHGVTQPGKKNINAKKLDNDVNNILNTLYAFLM